MHLRADEVHLEGRGASRYCQARAAPLKYCVERPRGLTRLCAHTEVRRVPPAGGVQRREPHVREAAGDAGGAAARAQRSGCRAAADAQPAWLAVRVRVNDAFARHAISRGAP